MDFAEATPLIVGTVLALAGLALVLSPLLGDGQPSPASVAKQKARDLESRNEEKSDGAVAALREIEFDRETGKLSDVDYVDLKTRYTKAALAELRASDVVAARAVTAAAAATEAAAAPTATLAVEHADPVQAAIARAKANQRSCTVCGPRTEADATYCSSCGRYLPGDCGSCGAPVELVGSRFCSGCGEHLAAA